MFHIIDSLHIAVGACPIHFDLSVLENAERKCACHLSIFVLLVPYCTLPYHLGMCPFLHASWGNLRRLMPSMPLTLNLGLKMCDARRTPCNVWPIMCYPRNLVRQHVSHSPTNNKQEITFRGSCHQKKIKHSHQPVQVA